MRSPMSSSVTASSTVATSPPCEHIFQHKLLYHLLTPEYWHSAAYRFEECGFDVYEAPEELEVDREMAAELTAPSHRKLRVREIAESLKESRFSLEGEIKKHSLDCEEMNRVMDYWITGLSKATGDFMRQDIKDLVESMPQLKQRVDTIVFNAELAEATAQEAPPECRGATPSIVIGTKLGSRFRFGGFNFRLDRAFGSGGT